MSTAYIMTNILESVVQSGTGWRIKAPQRPVAGKTGTTNNLFDAWFLGYTPRYTTGVWVGLDQEAPLENQKQDQEQQALSGLILCKTLWKENLQGLLMFQKE